MEQAEVNAITAFQAECHDQCGLKVGFTRGKIRSICINLVLGNDQRNLKACKYFIGVICVPWMGYLALLSSKENLILRADTTPLLSLYLA